LVSSLSLSFKLPHIHCSVETNFSISEHFFSDVAPHFLSAHDSPSNLAKSLYPPLQQHFPGTIQKDFYYLLQMNPVLAASMSGPLSGGAGEKVTAPSACRERESRAEKCAEELAPLCSNDGMAECNGDHDTMLHSAEQSRKLLLCLAACQVRIGASYHYMHTPTRLNTHTQATKIAQASF